ncbi:hypothetical protein ACWY4P_32165 [Streptomyces sp. LZ34]
MSAAYSPVPELNLLKELEDRVGGENISTGFDLREFGATTGIDTWSQDPEFLDKSFEKDFMREIKRLHDETAE